MSLFKKVAATAAAMMLAMGAFSPVAGAQEAVETVSPAPEVADTTTTLPPGTVKVVPETTSPSQSQAKEPSVAPKPEPAAPAADPAKPVAGPAAEGARECTPAVSVEGNQVLRSWSKVNIAFTGCGMEAGEVATATFPENSALNFQEGVYDIFLKDSNRKVGIIEATAGRATFRFTESVSHWQANVYTSVKQVETGDLSITTDFNGSTKTHQVGQRVLDCGPDCQPPREVGAHEKWASFENSRGQIAYQLWLVSNESSVTFSDKITDGNSEFLCDSLKPAAFENKGRRSNKSQIGAKLDVKADVQCGPREWTVTFSNVPANTWLQVDGWAKPLNKGLVDEARGLHYYGDQGTIAGKPWNAKAFVFGGGGTAWQALPPAPKTTPPAPSSTPAKPSSSAPKPAPSSSKTTTPSSSTPKPPATTEPTPGSSSGGGKGNTGSVDGSTGSNYFGSSAGSSQRLITAALSSGNSWLINCFPFLFGWGSATGSAAGSAAGSSKVTPAPAKPAAPVQQAPVVGAVEQPAITPVAHQAPQPQAAGRTALANTGPSGVHPALALAGLTILGGAALLVQRKRSYLSVHRPELHGSGPSFYWHHSSASTRRYARYDTSPIGRGAQISTLPLQVLTVLGTMGLHS